MDGKLVHLQVGATLIGRGCYQPQTAP